MIWSVDRPFPQAQGMMGIGGDGQGEGGSSLMKERSGYLLTSTSATLSGDDDGTKPSGLLRPDESWTLRRRKTSVQQKKKNLIPLNLNFWVFTRTPQWAELTSALPGCCAVGLAGRRGRLQFLRCGLEP